jgi:hypothetical protein
VRLPDTIMILGAWSLAISTLSNIAWAIAKSGAKLQSPQPLPHIRIPEALPSPAARPKDVLVRASAIGYM